MCVRGGVVDAVVWDRGWIRVRVRDRDRELVMRHNVRHVSHLPMPSLCPQYHSACMFFSKKALRARNL